MAKNRLETSHCDHCLVLIGYRHLTMTYDVINHIQVDTGKTLVQGAYGFLSVVKMVLLLPAHAHSSSGGRLATKTALYNIYNQHYITFIYGFDHPRQ